MSTAHKEGEATIVGLCWVEGVLKQKRMTKDGRVIIEDIPHAPLETEVKNARKKEFEDQPFSATERIPHDLDTINTSPLISKALAKEVERMGTAPDVMREMLTQYMEKILAINALLLRVIGSPESLAKRTEPLEIKESGLREYVKLQMEVLGGPWLDVKNKIK